MNKEQLLTRIQDLTSPLSPISVGHDTQLKSLSGIRCVAFDFYGTMFIADMGDIDFDEDEVEGNPLYFSKALEASGFEIQKSEAGKRARKLFKEITHNLITAAKDEGIYHPEPDIRAVWYEVLNSLLEEEYISGNLNKDAAVHFGIEFEFLVNDVWPVPDLDSLLNELLDHDLKLGIISNSQFYTPLLFESFLDKSPEEFGFDPNLLIWSFRTGLKKPSHDFYQLFINSAEKEDLKPEEILYIGNDIRKDIEPAKALGMKTALYIGDERSLRHELEDLEKTKLQPDLIIDDLHQILECLEL